MHRRWLLGGLLVFATLGTTKLLILPLLLLLLPAGTTMERSRGLGHLEATGCCVLRLAGYRAPTKVITSYLTVGWV